MELGGRKQKILTAVIDAYIRTGEPVGSKALAEMLDNAVSSATIRNEMAELASLGYLEQPHTSAGRIPTAKAFRLYIDRLMHRQALSEADRRGIDSLLSGASGDPEQAREMGRTIGGYLKTCGFTMDFAPDADVLTNPENPVIGDRAFSQDAETVARMAAAMAQGLQEQGVLPVYKHFPGHGDTAEDSHSGLARTDRTLAEMRGCEFLPFRLTENGFDPERLPAVMVGHIAAPALGDGDAPASLSYRLVTEVLRGEVLEGAPVLVVTDSLSMGAVTERYDSGQAAVRALQAGCDVLLMPAGLAEAFDAVVAAVEDGTISAARLDESVARVLRAKQLYAGLELPQEGEG